MTQAPTDDVAAAAQSGYRKFLRIETATLIAASLGAFTMSGYVHLEKYYQTLNVSIDRLNFGPQKLAIYGGASIATWVAATLFGIAAALLIAVLLALLERPGKEPPPHVSPPWAARFLVRASELSAPLKITAVVVAVASFGLGSWYLTMTIPSQAGRKAALNTASKCRERTLIYKNLDRIQACQIAESDDMLFLLKRTHADEFSVAFHTIEVSKEGLLRSETQEEELRFE